MKKSGEGEVEYRAAIAIFKKLVADFPTVPDYRDRLGSSHRNLGNLLDNQGKRDEAETELRAALGLCQKLVADYPAIPKYRSGLASIHSSLGLRLARLRQRKQAEAEHRAAIAIQQKLVTEFPDVSAHAMALAGSYCNLGHLVSDDSPGDALPWYDRAIAVLAPLVRKEPKLVLAQHFLRNSLTGRAAALDELERYDDAARDWARASSLAGGENRALQVKLMLSRVRGGQIEPALKDAEHLARNDSPMVLYQCAGIYALAHARTGDDKQAVRAVALLRRAIARGLRGVTQLKKEPALTSLRARADFRQLLAELEAKGK